MLGKWRGFKAAWGLTFLAASACSNDPSNDKPELPAAVGGNAADDETAGAANGGHGDEAGGTAASSNGGASLVEPAESQGGHGLQNAGGSNDGDAGSQTGQGGDAPSNETEGDVFVLGEPSAECNAAAPVDLSAPQAPGLSLPPSSGHPCDATGEPNDADGQACQLALGVAVQTSLSQPDDQVDKFVYHAEAGVGYAVVLNAVKCIGKSSLDAVQLTATSLASAGQTIQLSARTYFGKQDAFDIPPASSTSDQLLTVTADDPCDYKLTLFQSTAQGLVHAADHEPNDTPSTARAIELNRLVTSRLSNPLDARDYFTVPVQGNVTYSIRVSTEGCSGNSSLDSMTVQGHSLSVGDAVTNLNISAYLGGVYHAEFTPKTSGEERLAFSTAHSCEYQFYVIPSSICGLRHDKISYEPNDTASTAAPIRLGEQVRAELQSTESADYYSFEVEPDGQYTLALSPVDCIGTSSLDTLTVEVWSGRAKDVKKGSRLFYLNGGRETLQFSAGNSAQQLLVVQGGRSCDYTFQVTKD